MAKRPPGDFGRSLREARERRGVSLRQIAHATKIGMSALEALERNDISRLPGGIFSRAFVRSYAVEVGLDPEQTIKDFIAQFPHDAMPAGHPKAEEGGGGRGAGDARKRPPDGDDVPETDRAQLPHCRRRAVLRHGWPTRIVAGR